MGEAISLALLAMPLIEKFEAWIKDLFASAKAAGELSPEAEKAYQAHQAALLASPAWQVEPDPEQPPPTPGSA